MPDLLRRTVAFAAVGAASRLTLSARPALAQEQAAAGPFGNLPNTLKLKDLTADWRRVSLGTAGGVRAGGGVNDLFQSAMASEMGKGKGADALGAVMAMSMFGGGGGLAGEKREPTYYTKGQLFTFGGETFLVAYRHQRPEPNLMQMVMESEKNGGKDPDFAKLAADSKLNPDSPLTLSLVNTKTIGSMSDIRPFDLAAEIADAARDSSLLDLMAASQKEDKEKEKAAEAAPVPAPASKPAPKPAAKPAPKKPGR